MLHPSDRGFCAPLSPPSGPTHSGARPRVPSVSVPREKASRVHCDATARGSAVLLHADDQESLERSRYTLPEEDATPTQHLEPGRSGPPHHPHVHCFVAAGGLSFDRTHWIQPRYPFFLSVKVLSRVFRGKFVFALKRNFRQGKLGFYGNLKPLAHPKAFSNH